ncbi:FGGY family carbohydrate kinase [Erysipelothrix anatis]|uniref:FGGY family carbohydrate kinase n=1 Tax=Erysipelothrix anatis TaxID=2683713 RepID=UPI00135B46E8|nr:FGGY family carbohydrate kinase [Erysipelothrix anatis]
MMTIKRILSIDIGTTNIKAAFFYGNRYIDIQTREVTTYSNGRRQTQNPEDILKSVRTLIETGIDIHDITDVVITTAMHTLIYETELDEFSEMIIWSDNRSEAVIEVLQTTSIPFYQKTGTPIHPMSPVTKLYQVRNESVYRIHDLKSYLMIHLTGLFLTDVSSASASGCFNIHTHCWDGEILDVIHRSPIQFPEVVTVTHQARMTNSKQDITITIGSTDGVMASHFFREKAYLDQSPYVMSIGTSIGLRYYAQQPVLSKTGNTFCYILNEGSYLCGNASNNGGNLYQWVNQTYFKNTLSFERLIELLELADPDEMELYAKPYAFGERGPFWRIHQSMKLSFESNSSEQIAQAIFLGMLANIDLMLESLAFERHMPLFVTGGFLKNQRMAQRVADLLGVILIQVADENSVCEAAVRLLDVNLPLKAMTTVVPQSLGTNLTKQKAYIVNNL